MTKILSYMVIAELLNILQLIILLGNLSLYMYIDAKW